MRITITSQNWQTKKVAIKDRTFRVLKNGKVIPTALNMMRRAGKVS